MAPANGEAPVTLDELADLQAGLLSDADAARLRARVAADPDAAELLGALELVGIELTDLDDEPLPDDVAALLDAAIAAEQAASPASNDQQPDADEPESSPATPVIDLAARRRRRLLQGLGGLVAAAAVVGVVIGVLPRTPPPQAGSVPAYGATDLASAWPSVAGMRDLGLLADPLALRSCLNAGGLSSISDAQLLGARPVTLDGRMGVLLAIAAPPDGGGPRVTLAVFDPGCAPDALLAETTVPR